jgi:MFS family permease
MGLWYCCVGVATTISPLINYGLGSLHTKLLSWKPMFLILGAVTICWSFVLWFALPDSPLATKNLNEQERKIAIKRLERNNAGTITTVFNKKQFIEAFCDYKTYSCALIVLLTGVPSGYVTKSPSELHLFSRALRYLFQSRFQKGSKKMPHSSLGFLPHIP